MFSVKSVCIVGLLIIFLTSVIACQRHSTGKLSKDQKEILNLYSSKHLAKKNQYLFHKSVDRSYFLNTLSPPLTPEDFKLPEIATLSSNSQKDIDTLFSKQELKYWSNKMKEYQPIQWNKNIFGNQITFINKSEIPDYLSRTDIPPPELSPHLIHYLSTPFIYSGNRETALLYSRIWTGPDNNIQFHYYMKEGDKWTLIKESRINTVY
jgi:hypothetical protein